MKLAALEPCWVKTAPRGAIQHLESAEGAEGIRFLCPDCFSKNGGPEGTHMVLCWSRSRGAPDDALPGPGRWIIAGESFESLSFAAEPGTDKRSVQLIGGCSAHFNITNGEVTPA